MNYQYNEQFAAATRQFADAAARINHLALENAQKVFGLQLAALEENAEATFSFLGQAADVKGVQIARENVERVISVGQEVLGATVKTNEAIAELARTQIESATAKAQDQAQGAVAAATKASKRR